MRILILIFIIIFSKTLQSQPSGIISELMDTKVSQFTYGMHRCADRLEKEENNINIVLRQFAPSRSFELGFNNCYYHFEKNEIQLIFKIYERTSSTTLDPMPEISNQLCSDLLFNIRSKFVINLGDNVWNFIVQEFGNEGFNLSIDKKISKNLKDYIFIYIGNVNGHICKSKLDIDEEVLFFQ